MVPSAIADPACNAHERGPVHTDQTGGYVGLGVPVAVGCHPASGHSQSKPFACAGAAEHQALFNASVGRPPEVSERADARSNPCPSGSQC